MSKKNKKTDRTRRTATERTCRRCGCTELHACRGGCCWVRGYDVCNRCATAHELLLAEMLDWQDEIRERVWLTTKALSETLANSLALPGPVRRRTRRLPACDTAD